MIEQPSIEVEIEIARIEAAYQQRGADALAEQRYSLFHEAALLHLQSLERHLLAMLKRHGFTHLADKRVLDVGCGSGLLLRRFLDYGARPEQLCGVDLLPERIAAARRLNPALDWRAGSAHRLPYPDASFDIVMSVDLFSSILRESLRQQIADEMWRVLKPGGVILCHDFIYGNPRNAAVRAFSFAHLRKHFDRPGARFAWRRMTLAPPISRALAPRSSLLAYLGERLKLFNTHMLASVSLEAPRDSGS